MIGFSILFFAFVSDLPARWEDIKAGQCLTVEQLQSLSGVANTEAYEVENCKTEYPLKGHLFSSYACGLEIDSGYWEREIVQHKMAGFFFPSPVPCKKSISYFKGEFQIFEEADASVCDFIEPKLLYSQTEEMFTKKFGAGQGDLYLPHPLVITRTWQQEDLGYEACEQTQLSLSYDGWGKLSGEINKVNCWTGEETLCRKAKMKNSETEDGALCLKFLDIKSCH